MNDSDFLQYLKDKDTIEKMVYQYASALDQRDWALLPPMAIDDMQFNYGGVVEGNSPDAWVAMIRSNLDGCGPSQHLFSNVRINTDYSDDANHTASVAFYGRVMHAGKGEERNILFDFWGEYRCQLIRVRDDNLLGWRFSKVEQVPFHFTGDMKILKNQ